jgi:zinc transport system permease protein
VIEALQYGFMQRALVACTVIAMAAPMVGCFIVQRRQALIGDGMGHMAFAGVGLAFIVGLDPLIGALVLTGLAALALVRLTRLDVGGDLSLALIFYGGLAAGFLFASRSGGGQNQVLALLFGSSLNLSWGQVAAVSALAAVVVLVVALLYPQLVAMAFDEAAARAAGVRTQGLVLALTLLVALVVVGGMSSIGLLLISAMMVIPVATAALVATSYRMTLCVASVVGGLCAVTGLLASFYADVPTGSAIVLVALAAYCITAFVRMLAVQLRRSSRVRVPA